jgi:hypothetical protein
VNHTKKVIISSEVKRLSDSEAGNFVDWFLDGPGLYLLRNKSSNSVSNALFRMFGSNFDQGIPQNTKKLWVILCEKG